VILGSYSGNHVWLPISAQNDYALLGRVVWAESDNGQYNGFQTQAYFDEKAAVAVSIVNRVDILNYKILISNGSGGYISPATLGWGPARHPFTQVLNQTNQYASVSNGDVTPAFQNRMNKVLAGDINAKDCVSLVNSYQKELTLWNISFSIHLGLRARQPAFITGLQQDVLNPILEHLSPLTISLEFPHAA